MSGTDTESRSAGLRRAWLLRLGTSSVVLVAWFLIFAVGAVALLLFDPVFCATSGKTWNHEVPSALALAAVLLLGRAGERDSLAASAVAGVCAGLATGFRLTFAPMLLPMVLAAALYALPRRRQVIHAAWFGIMATIALAPSRYQYQHHFVLVPFLVLSIILGMQSGIRWLPSGRVAAAGFLIVVLIGIILHINDYRSVVEIWKTTDWFAAKARRFGAEIHRRVPSGKVLTLAPALPLAGHVPIYPEFATGPFSWRNASLVPAERRRRLHVVAPADLEAFLAADPPAGILTGFEDEGDLEKPLNEYAQRHGYTLTELPKKRHLWVAPNAPE